MSNYPEITQELLDLTYRVDFEESGNPKFIFDRDGKILNANNAFARYFGKQVEAFIGMSIYSLLPQKVADERKKHADEAFLTGKSLRFEDESHGRFFRHTVYPVPEQNGKILKLFVFVEDITEAKLAEKKSKKLTAFTREVMEVFPGAFAILDSRGAIVSCNSYFRNVVIGKEEDQLPGINTFDLLHPDDKALVFEKLDNILQKGIEESGDVRVLTHGSTEYRWFRITTKPLIIDGEIFLASTGTDIEALKKKEQEISISTEKQIFESKARLDTALESMNDALFIFDAENQLTEYNTAYARFLKFSDKKECLKRLRSLENFPALFDVSLPDGTPAPLEQWAIPRALRGETCTNVEYHVRRKDTGQQWIGSYNFSPIRNNEGKIIGAVTTARDITQHKKAEAALKESEERFRKFFEQHSALMMIIDPETGDISDVNNASADFYGWSREQLIDMNVKDINIDKPEDSIKRLEEWKNSDKRTFTVTHRKADGSICDLEVFGEKIEVQDRWLAYLILHDVTEKKRIEEEKKLLESHIQKSQRMETIGTLAGGIAHDFNNILTPILGFAEMGMMKPQEEESSQEYFAEIMQAAERAKNIISQILAFSKAQANKPITVCVQSILDEALQLLRPSIPSTILIEKHIEPFCRNILADPSKIHQVIINLCTNAFQAMENRGGTLSIELAEVIADRNLLKILPELHEQPYIKLTISDTGCGMDKGTMEHIFEPFFTTKAVNKGTGLGLSVVHGIITEHKGVINVESIPGKGSSFHIFLPVIDQKIIGGETGENKKKLVPICNASVLFVDDEQAILKTMTIIFKKLGYSIRALNSPKQALEIFRQSPGDFDLVITDLTMPEMTGIDLASEIHTYRPDIPVILMTGFGKDIDNVKELEKYGICQILKKPVKIETLVSSINNVLSNSLPRFTDSGSRR